MIKAIIVCAYLFTWAACILGAMYLTQTWYPLVLLVFLLTFTAELDNEDKMNDFHEEHMRKRAVQLIEENEQLKRTIKAHEAVWRLVHDKVTNNRTLKAIASEMSEGKIPEHYMNVKT